MADFVHISLSVTGEYDQNLCNETDPTCVKCSLRYPSCVGLADGNQTFPERVGKPDYITCFSNRTVAISKCVDGYFDPVSKKCIQNAIHSKCCAFSSQFLTFGKTYIKRKFIS